MCWQMKNLTKNVVNAHVLKYRLFGQKSVFLMQSGDHADNQNLRNQTAGYRRIAHSFYFFFIRSVSFIYDNVERKETKG